MRASFKRVLALTLAIFGIFICQLGFAQQVKNDEPLKVPFSTGEYRPYTSEKMPGFGATAELVSAVCKAAGIQPEFRFFPWKRAEATLREGSAWGAFPYSSNAERKQEFDFSDSLYSVSNALVYYDDNPKTRVLSGTEDLATLKAFKFGVISGSFAEPKLKELGITYQTVTTVDQLIQMLRFNRIDFYIDDEATIFDAANRIFPDDMAHFRAMNTPFDERKTNGVMVSRTFPHAAEILKRFNAGLAKIKRTGEYEQILAKYHLRQK